jgi:DNA polymerase-4
MPILHLDLDAFFASVEILLNPDLKDKPLVVAWQGARGVVTTASYEARKFGVHSAMPLSQALRLCPQAIVVSPRHGVYSEYSHRVMNILHESSPLVEQVSIDEAYVEIEPSQDAARIAREIQQRIKTEIGLDCTVAVASNKLVSKVACGAVKPRGFVVVSEGDEEKFLAPLPIDKLPGAGKVTRGKLARWNVKTIGDLARVPVEELHKEFGKWGIYLHEGALGRDDSPVVTEREPKSSSQENTFERDTRDAAQLEKELTGMSAGVARDLAKSGYVARTIVLKLRYGDFTTFTRQMTLSVPTNDANQIHECAMQLFRKHWDRRRAVRLIGVGAHNLIEATSARQLEMFADGR